MYAETSTHLFLLPGPHGTSLAPFLYGTLQNLDFWGIVPQKECNILEKSEFLHLSRAYLLAYGTSVRRRGLKDSFPSKDW